MFVNNPPLGWNSWNTFADKINEEVVLGIADAMVETGLKDAGYEYVIIDDVWQMKERDANGNLVANPEKFPHGIKYVSDYVHSKGLKFGMYSCAGYMTCAGFPGSYGYEWQDAKTFASWGVDYLKYDYCFHPTSVSADVLYKRMGMALRNCGRDILLSACSWGVDNTKQWIKETGAHMWRSTADIWDSWESMKGIALSQVPFQEYNGHGCFNDMDMLVVGLGGEGYAGVTGMTNEEYKMHFSYWALLNSPLIIGCDIRNMSEETKAILMNKEVIAINQDAYCQPFIVKAQKWEPNEARKSNEPFYINYPTDQVIFAKYLNNGDIAILELENYHYRNHDQQLLAQAKKRVYGILDWFSQYENQDGLLEKIQGWVFVEWSRSNDLTQDINFPTNMLYTKAMQTVGRLYQDNALQKKAESLMQLVRNRSYNGEFFVDNEIYKDGKLVSSGESTETCQYYAFYTGTATPETYPELWHKLMAEFGPERENTNAYPQIAPSNMFIGYYLRLELLRLTGQKDRIKQECKGYFYRMATITGTLWENKTDYASCNHGFASYAAALLLDAENEG